jgi:hypothetical protein
LKLMNFNGNDLRRKATTNTGQKSDIQSFHEILTITIACALKKYCYRIQKKPLMKQHFFLAYLKKTDPPLTFRKWVWH